MATVIDKFLSAFHHVYVNIHYNLHFLLSIVLSLWIIQIFNASSGYRLNSLGIYPRRAQGLIGIFFSPFLHGSNQHLFLNSIPLFILAALMLVEGKHLFLQISFFIMVVSGFVTWIFGRSAYHIGASSLILGYWGFLLFNAYTKHSMVTLFLALVCLYYFGSLIYSLFPQKEGISWEGHLAGFLSGVLASYLLAHSYIH